MISNFNNEELKILLNYAKFNPDLYLYIYENLNIKLNLKELCKDDILYFIKFYYPFEFNNFKNNNIIVKDLMLEDYRAIMRLLIENKINLKWFENNVFNDEIELFITQIIIEQYNIIINNLINNNYQYLIKYKKILLRTVINNIAYDNQINRNFIWIEELKADIMSNIYNKKTIVIDVVANYFTQKYKNLLGNNLETNKLYNTSNYNNFSLFQNKKRWFSISNDQNFNFCSVVKLSNQLISEEMLRQIQFEEFNENKLSEMFFQNNKFAEERRNFGPILNLYQLKCIQYGTLPPMNTIEIKKTIFNVTKKELRKNIIFDNYKFDNNELQYLLIALLNGSIINRLHYHRCIPLDIVNDLIKYMDDYVIDLMNCFKSTYPNFNNVEFFYDIFYSDALFILGCNAFKLNSNENINNWKSSIFNYLNNNYQMLITKYGKINDNVIISEIMLKINIIRNDCNYLYNDFEKITSEFEHFYNIKKEFYSDLEFKINISNLTSNVDNNDNDNDNDNDDDNETVFFIKNNNDDDDNDNDDNDDNDDDGNNDNDHNDNDNDDDNNDDDNNYNDNNNDNNINNDNNNYYNNYDEVSISYGSNYFYVDENNDDYNYNQNDKNNNNNNINALNNFTNNNNDNNINNDPNYFYVNENNDDYNYNQNDKNNNNDNINALYNFTNNNNDDL